MSPIFAFLFDITGFHPRWGCGKEWTESPWIGWVHIVSDSAIFLAYFAVPIVVAWFVLGRSNIRFPRVFWFFLGLVFFSCGTAHLIEVILFYSPIYYASGLTKVVTAIVSCVGVVVLARVMPHALQLKTPEELDKERLERKQVEDTLEQERYLFHLLLEHLPEVIYFKDAEGRFLRISRTLAHRLGLDDPLEAIGKSDSDFFPPEYADQAQRDEQKLMESGISLIGKQENPHWPDGTVQWVLTTKVPLESSTGEVLGTFGVSHDITPLKKSQQRLQESEERYAVAVKGSSDGLWDWEVNSDVVHFSPRFKELMGFAEDEMENRFQDWEARLHPEDHAPTLRAIRTHLKGKEPYDVEYRLKMKSGEYRWFRARGQAVWDKDGNPTRMAGSISDITDRKDVEIALREAMHAAEAANRAKSDFLANMSHEIRTPMNAIIGLTELVIGSELTTVQKDYLATVLQSAESLMDIINEILDFSKIEAGKLQLEHEPFSLREELGDALKALGIRAHDKNIELAWQVTPDVPDALKGDSVRIRQIVVNLVGNAIKFTETGEVVFQVTCEAQTETEARLQFQVTDTGEGIPPEKLESIFRAFEQVDASTTRKHGGTGLGLSISARLIELMDGQIGVESKPGEGSRFYFTVCLPRASEEELATRPRSITVLEDVPVLIVDDNKTNCLIVQELLGGWKMKTATASGAKEALDLLQSRHAQGSGFQVLITDVNMPEIDGFTLIEQIRNQAEFANLVIIALTSGAREEDVERASKLSVAAELLKPVKPSELLDAMVEVITSPDNGTAPKPTPEVELPSLNKMEVLLVEDGDANRKLALGLLNKWGLNVTVAVNGKEAVDLFEPNRFDVILMDVQMPEMDGHEATQRIRELEKETGGHVLIVGLTAHAMKGDRDRCISSGMDHYVAKPIRAEELHQILSEPELAPRREVPKPKEQTPPSPESSVVDWVLARKHVQNDEDLLVIMIEAASEEAPQLMNQLRESLQKKDSITARRMAHTLLGTMNFFGAEGAQWAAQMELLAKESKLEEVQEILPSLESALSELLREIQERASRRDFGNSSE